MYCACLAIVYLLIHCLSVCTYVCVLMCVYYSNCITIMSNICDSTCCIRQDGTRFNIQCAFNYSDNLVNISQVTPVTIQTKII